MTAPRISYPIPLPRARLQAVGHADRPVCAMVAAMSAWMRSEPLRGVATGLDPAGIGALFDPFLVDQNINAADAMLWAKGVNGVPIIGGTWPAVVNGLALSPYQHSAIAKLSCAGGVLSLGCGLGKTITALAAAQAYGGRLVVICPLNAVPTWKRAAPAGTIIQSLDSAHHLLGLPSTGGCIIYDECHLAGEPTARRTKSCHELRTKFTQGLCLTGTLLHGGVHKALSVLDLAIPGASLFASRWAAGEYFHCLVKKSIGSRTVTVLEKPSGPNRAAFLEYLSRHVIALTTESPEVKAAFTLPGQSLYDVNLGEPWASLSDEAAALVRGKIDAGEPGVMSASECAHALCSAGAEAKVEWVMDKLADEPVVIFANYTKTLDLMEAALRAASISFVRVDGSVTGAARGECQRKFQAGEVQVFLGQMTAAGLAMDLYRAPYSIALDHPWKPADYSQALARTHRRGQTMATHHWDLCANRLQARVVERLRSGDEFNSAAAEYQEMKRGLVCHP